jgi:3-methyl-2-oxobutanoate hydroxymethyltransferase
MSLYALGELAPQVHPTAFVHPTAQLIGDVVVHAEASVWPGAVLRADFNRIEIGEGSSVQDNAVLHPRSRRPATIGRDCVVGHLAHLEGVLVEDTVLIGSGSIVLEEACVRTGGTVAAGALVLAGTEVRPGRRAQGVPAELVACDLDPEAIRAGAQKYRDVGRWYREHLTAITPSSHPSVSSSSARQEERSERVQSGGRPAQRRPVTLPLLAEKKRLGEPIVMVTAYDLASAQAAEEAEVDLVLAGDTAAMTVLGYPSTVAVTLEEMLVLTKAARRGLRTPLFIGDLPFGSYERSHEQAIASAQRLVKEAGCDVIKFEGPSPERARAIISAGIPVMGHLGLTPQTATALGGGFRAQARSSTAARRLLEDALELERAGCFAVVLEAVPAEVAALVSQRLEIPTIGIGAGPDTDGQVLVLNDLLGIFEEFKPRFVKSYARLRREMVGAVSAFAEEVRARRFPGEQHCYTMAPGEQERFLASLENDG